MGTMTIIISLDKDNTVGLIGAAYPLPLNWWTTAAALKCFDSHLQEYVQVTVISHCNCSPKTFIELW